MTRVGQQRHRKKIEGICIRLNSAVKFHQAYVLEVTFLIEMEEINIVLTQRSNDSQHNAYDIHLP